MKGAESSQIVAEVDHADDNAVRGPPSRAAGKAAAPSPEDTPVALKAKLSRIKKNRAAAAAKRSSTQAQEKALARIKLGGEKRQGKLGGENGRAAFEVGFKKRVRGGKIGVCLYSGAMSAAKKRCSCH